MVSHETSVSWFNRCVYKRLGMLSGKWTVDGQECERGAWHFSDLVRGWRVDQGGHAEAKEAESVGLPAGLAVG